MKYLFEYVWETMLEPLISNDKDNDFISDENRKVIAFKRYMTGNLFLLIKFGVSHDDILDKLNVMSSEDIMIIKEMYIMKVNEIYRKGLIDMNEYHNYKNIFIMIPPNILRKDIY